MFEFRTKLLSSKAVRYQASKTTGFLVISVVVALSACSASPNATNIQSSATNVPSSEAINSRIAQGVKTALTIPGVSNSKEISFKIPAKGVIVGFFDAVDGSGKLTHSLPKTKPLEVSGWAVSADKKKPADSVIITMGEANTPVAVAPVKLNRPDVATSLKNPILVKSGWITSIAPSAVSGKKVVLKAWSYDTQTKRATLLQNKHEIVFQ